MAAANEGLSSRWIVSTAGDVITPYNGHSYNDDLAYAAAWLHRLTGNGAYLDSAKTYYDTHVSVSSYNLTRTLNPRCLQLATRPVASPDRQRRLPGQWQDHCNTHVSVSVA